MKLLADENIPASVVKILTEEAVRYPVDTN